MAKNETQQADTTDEGDAPLLDLNDASVKKMMARAEKRGTVTIDEINAAIPADQNEMIEDIMSRLSERGVTVVENEEASDDEEECAVAGRFVVVRDGDEEYRFRIEAEDGQLMATSEPYTSKSSALKGVGGGNQAQRRRRPGRRPVRR